LYSSRNSATTESESRGRPKREFAIDDVDGQALDLGLAGFPENAGDGEAAEQGDRAVGNAAEQGDALRARRTGAGQAPLAAMDAIAVFMRASSSGW
jgi:hypothetical protein